MSDDEAEYGCRHPCATPRKLLRPASVCQSLHHSLPSLGLVSDQAKPDKPPPVRLSWWFLGGLVLVLLVASGLVIPRLIHRDHDPCQRVLPYAAAMGLRLSDAEDVISCASYPSFPDSSAKVVVRTESPATRNALLERSEVSEDLERNLVSLNDGPFHEEVRRPNLERSEQVYTANRRGGDVLTITYEERKESGLLLTVWAMET
jgi:hypothetical protein